MIQFENVVATIVENMLPKFTRKIALWFEFRVNIARLNRLGNESSYKILCFNMIFYRPNNYTKVFFHNARTDDQWFMTSDHDSCWRSDGFREIRKFIQTHEFRGSETEIDFSIVKPLHYIEITEMSKFSYENRYGDIKYKQIETDRLINDTVLEIVRRR